MLGPPAQRILTSADSSLGTAPSRLDSLPTNDTNPEPSYELFFTFAGA